MVVMAPLLAGLLRGFLPSGSFFEPGGNGWAHPVRIARCWFQFIILHLLFGQRLCVGQFAPCHALLKQAVEFDHTEIGADMRARGVVAMLDGASVVKVPAVRLPAKFGFMLAHPSATVAPVKLEDFGIHNDTPLSSGTIVTGRVCYDAFVLDNKKTGIYYQATT